MEHGLYSRRGRSPRSRGRRTLAWANIKTEWRPSDPLHPSTGPVWLISPVEFSLTSLTARIANPVEDKRDHQYVVFFNADGSPADKISKEILDRTARNFLSIYYCRLLPELPPAPPEGDSQSEWENWLRKHLPTLARSRKLIQMDADNLDHVHYLQTQTGPALPKRYRSDWPLSTAAPSHLERALLRRVALVFDRLQRDPLVRRCVDILKSERWRDWRYRNDLMPLYRQAQEEPRLGRLMYQLEELLRIREAIKRRNMVLKRPVRTIWNLPDGRVVEFSFRMWPREGESAVLSPLRERAMEVLHCVLRHRDVGGVKASYLAAGGWLAQKFISAPQSLAQSPRITLNAIAEFFGVTRNQVHYAAEILKGEVAERLRARS